MSASLPLACTDTGFGVLRVTGEDAIAFLHGQLSSDVRALAPGEGQYFSYNSPKGRVLANGALWRSPPQTPPAVTLVLAAELAEPMRRRLAMYVLRAKVGIDDASASCAPIGIGGDGAADAARAAFGAAPERNRAVTIRDQCAAFALADGRIVVTSPAAERPVLHAALARHASNVGRDEWRGLGVAAGVAFVGAATTDLFVPQMLNWDVVGGISFQKGCYPGQEIVARMQYLGRLKERLFAFQVDALDVAPGARLYGTTFGEQACGTVVAAAPDSSRGSALLAVAQVAAVDAGGLALGAADGPALARRALPYDVPGVSPPPAPLR